MQHLKINQIESIIKKHDMDINFIIFDFFKKFKVKNICDRIKIKKDCGYSIIEILLIILTIPLVLVKSVNSLYRSEFKWLAKMNRCTIYRFLNFSNYNWRNLIYKICIKFVKTFYEETAYSAFVIDDTTLFKEGYKGERITKVYDHSEKKYGYGYKQATIAYCDGKSVIPLDFSLHGETQLAEEKVGKQYVKVRKNHTFGAKRLKEFLLDKITSATKMINSAIENGIKAKYAIFDSWYSSNDFINALIEKGLIVVCAIKANRKCVYNDRELNMSGLLTLLKNTKKAKMHCNKKIKYYDTIIKIPKIGEIKICFCKLRNHKEWKIIISTDVSMSSKKIMQIYTLRWSIEVFFKEAKGLLRMGKCQSVDFDAQISNVSSAMLLYIIIAYYKRINEVETTGTLFENIRQNIYKKTFAEMLWDFFVEIFDYIFKKLYIEGKTTIKRMKNTSVFKFVNQFLSAKKFNAELEIII